MIGTSRKTAVFLRTASAQILIRRMALSFILMLPCETLGDQQPETGPEKAGKAHQARGVLDARCVDGSIIKLTLLDERLELITPYGKLLIPVADIVRIELAWRTPDAIARRIEKAVSEMGHSDFKRRQVASDELTNLAERAFPALLEAAKHSDPEVATRAEKLLDKIRKAVPAEHLEMRTTDFVFTETSKIAGQLTATSIKVKTAQFGEQQLALTDVRALGTAATVDNPDVLPDPGMLARLQHQVGKTFVFRVTGAPPGSQGAWGTNTYTTDSTLSVAAVHAGILKSGQTGLVRVTIVGHVPGFQPSMQNDIMSEPNGPWPGFRIEK